MESLNKIFELPCFSSTKNTALGSTQKAIFLELLSFFSKNTVKTMDELSEELLDMKCDYYFHLHHQLKNLKVFVTKGISIMCPGMESPTSSLPLVY